MIDIHKKKGSMLASLILGLAAAHAINDEPRSKDIPGALNFARLMMLGCHRGLQRAVEDSFDENRTPEENLDALHKAFPNHEMSTLLRSFSFEQLKDMRGISNALEMIASNLGASVQQAAATMYPAQFKKEIEEADAEGIQRPLTIHVIDMSQLFADGPPRPAPRGKEPLVS